MAKPKNKRNFRVETAQIANLRLLKIKPAPRTGKNSRKKKAEEIIHKLIEAIKTI